jgi:hypothetical protein
LADGEHKAPKLTTLTGVYVNIMAEKIKRVSAETLHSVDGQLYQVILIQYQNLPAP